MLLEVEAAGIDGHLGDEAAPVFGEVDRGAALAVGGGVKGGGGAELFPPRVPGLACAGDAARAMAAYEDSKAVAGLGRIVPPPGAQLDHGEG